MGMYDYINGDQVKIFYTPIFDEVKRNTWHSGGRLKSYNTGDTVPIKTLYYKLPKDFLILSDDLDYNNIQIHVIEDSKVVETTKLNDLDDSFFNKYETVLNCRGISINIKSKQDCIDYIEATENKFKDISKNGIEVSNIIKTNLHPLCTLKRHLLGKNLQKKEIPIEQKLKNIENTLNQNLNLKTNILNLFNLKSIEELTGLFTKGNESLEYTQDTMLKYIDSKVDFYNSKINELNEENKPTFEEIIKKYNKRWIKEDKYEKEALLGEFIDCFIYSYMSKDDEINSFLGDPFEKYLILKSTIKDLLEENPRLVESYCTWQEFNEEEKETIKSLSYFILKSDDKDECKDIISNISC